jgi:mono/diheme cytochrome c family protein
MKFMIKAAALISAIGVSHPAIAQSADPSIGRLLAETICSACHQVGGDSSSQSPKSDAPRFVDISRMPSTTALAIKVFLQSSHPTMPNIILSPQEIDSVATYILTLTRH